MQPIGQGFTASVFGRSNYVLANPSTTQDMMNNNSSVSSPGPADVESDRESWGVVAEKRVRTWQGESEQSGIAILRELKVLSASSIRRHPNIVRLVMYSWEESFVETPTISPVLSLERATGSLAQIQGARKLSYAQKRGFILGVSRGLSVLHSCGVIHGDLKSENVLLFQQGNEFVAKLCDFGFSILLADTEGSKTRLNGGTALWMAPECLARVEIPTTTLAKTDVYSLGLLVWRLLLDGLNPFEIPGLTKGRDIAELKSASTPSLLARAQFSVLLIDELKPRFGEIFRLLEASIQLSPSHRSLQAVLYLLGDSTPAQSNTNWVTLDPMDILDEACNFFDARNLPILLRRRALKHLKAGARTLEESVKRLHQHVTFCPISQHLMQYSLGDGGLDDDDDPEGALRLLTECAERQNISSQAFIVRMYDYFGFEMPDAVARNANTYLANGVANGSLTAYLDYATYWPRLKYQTLRAPDEFLMGLRMRWSGGIGMEVADQVFHLHDTTLLKSRIASGMSKDSLKAAYELERGNNLIHGAAMKNLPSTADVLIQELNVDLNQRNSDGDTPLLLACRHGHFNMVLKLLAKKANPAIANNNGETPLHWVINVPDTSSTFQGMLVSSLLQLAIKMLVEKGGNLESKAQLWSAGGDWHTQLKWAAGTPLHRAVSRRNLVAAKYLLEVGADPLATNGQQGNDTATPLDIAAHHHNAPMLKLLLDACPPRFSVNTIDEYGTTLFSRAISLVTVTEMIIIHGKQYTKAIVDTVDVLLAHGLNLDIVQVTTGFTQPQALRIRKVDANMKDRNEFDALYIATYYEKLAWVQCILNSPKCATAVTRNINRPNGSMGYTPLHTSIQDGRRGIFRALLSAGADPSLEIELYGVRIAQELDLHNRMGCLHLAATQGDPDLFFTKRLLGYELDLERGDISGTTPFCLAVMEAHFPVANALLAAGADINGLMGAPKAPKDKWNTVLERVIVQGANDVRRLLYLLAPERQSAGVKTSCEVPWLTRPGPPASMKLGSTTVLHLFLDTNEARSDSTYVACLRVLLNACTAAKPNILNTLASPRRWLDEDSRKDTGMTPLHLATRYGNAVAVRMLLGAGADRRVATASGAQPLLLAREGLKRTADQIKREMYKEVVGLLEGRNNVSIRKATSVDTEEQLLSRLIALSVTKA
jgi:ankyrin repeat protein